MSARRNREQRQLAPDEELALVDAKRTKDEMRPWLRPYGGMAELSDMVVMVPSNV